MSEAQQQLEYILPECFINPEKIEEYLTTLKQLIMQGAQFNENDISYYKYMDKDNVSDKLIALLNECYEQLQANNQINCKHEVFSESNCVNCGISYTKIQENCKHNWLPAGHKKNRDRVHNKANGKGKYTAYKCEFCKKFKRRYLQ